MNDKIMTCPQCGRRYAEPADRCEDDGCPLYGPEVMARLGMTLGNYKIHSILGEGGMGVVYRGEHSMLRKPVAIKILHERFARREGSVDQFLHEARAASQIRHPNIVDVTDFGTAEDGSVYFVMEYLEGESLEDILGRDRRLELFNAINVTRQIAQSLASAHDHGIVHLDLKPENVFLISRPGRRRIVRRVEPDDGQFVVEAEGSFDFVKLLDFGVARFMNNPKTGARPGMVFGTPHYMSPEQARGRPVDGRSDIYSLGILLYEMILGDVPFDGDSAQDILSDQVSRAVPPPRGRSSTIEVDESTNETILMCLEKSPDSRYQTMDELLQALEECFTDRVFLRDAHRLPGAIEAGIVPPPRPPRTAVAGQEPTTALKPKRSSENAPPEAPRAPGAKTKTLTDELSELLGTAENMEADGADEFDTVPTTRLDIHPDNPDEPGGTNDPPPSRDGRTTAPQAPAGTPPSGDQDVSLASGAHQDGSKRRSTAPLSSKGGE